MDFNGLADPYVKLHLLPGACKVRARAVDARASGANSIDLTNATLALSLCLSLSQIFHSKCFIGKKYRSVNIDKLIEFKYRKYISTQYNNNNSNNNNINVNIEYKNLKILCLSVSLSFSHSLS